MSEERVLTLMKPAVVEAFRFGEFELDLSTLELRRQGRPVRLQPQPARVLALLVARAGELVPREDIRREVWGGETHVDFDQGLNFCIKQVRLALGDNADVPRFVETLPRRGYRFLARVERVASPAAAARPRAVSAAVAGAEAEAPSLRILTAPVRPRAPSRPRPALLALAAVVGLAAAAAAWLSGRGSGRSPSWVPLTFQRGHVTGARFAASGEVLISAAWGGEPAALFSVSSVDPAPRRLGHEGAELVRVSPMGEVAYLLGERGPRRRLVRASIASGAVKELAADVTTADWSPGTDEVAAMVLDHGVTYVEWPLGTRLGQVENPDALRLAPDGSRLAVLEHPIVGDDTGSVVVFERDGSRRTLSQGWDTVCGLAWSPRGDRVWFTADRRGEGWTLREVDLAGRERVLLHSAEGIFLHDVSPDGRLLIDQLDRRQETVLARDGEGERNVSWLDMTSVNDISDDGQWLLLAETGRGTGSDYGTYLRRADAAAPVKLSSGLGTSLSSDGLYVTVLPMKGRERLEIVPTGAGARRALRDPQIKVYEWAAFFPDGRRLLIVGQDARGVARLYVRDLDGPGPPRPISPAGVKVQKFKPIAPDGQRVVARCPDSGYCLYPVDGGDFTRVPGMDGLRPLRWASDTQLIVQERRFTPPVKQYRLELATGRRELLREVAPADRAGVTAMTGAVLTPDGRTYAYDFFRRLSQLHVVTGVE